MWISHMVKSIHFSPSQLKGQHTFVSVQGNIVITSENFSILMMWANLNSIEMIDLITTAIDFRSKNKSGTGKRGSPTLQNWYAKREAVGTSVTVTHVQQQHVQYVWQWPVPSSVWRSMSYINHVLSFCHKTSSDSKTQLWCWLGQLWRRQPGN